MARKKNQESQTGSPRNLADYIEPLTMNGLRGRMLRLPAPANKKREILLLYGHHASLERMFGLAEYLNRFGAVTVPDLPGFGGMEPFYKLREKPTLDNLADYLAAFVKLTYKRKRVTIVGTSFGFMIVTRMLQRYPELVKRVDILVSFVGFVHKEDFHLSRNFYAAMRSLTWLLSNRIPAFFVRHVLFQPALLHGIYSLMARRNSKIKHAEDKAEQQALIEFETYLWRANDIRTQADTGITFLTADLCDRQVDLPVYHIAVDADKYFDNHVVEQHLKIIFSDVHVLKVKLKNHAPTVVATADEVAPYVPPKLRRILQKDPN